MKIFNKKLVWIMVAAMWFSCEDSTVDYNASSPTGQEVPDPYLQIQTPVIGFQAGTENYEYGINVINPANKLQLEEVKVYSVFTDAATGSLSNEVLLTTLPVEGTNRNVIEGTLDYSQLKAGLTVDGAPLPDDEVLLKVGSGWKLRFEGVTKSGEVVRLPGNMNVAVLSRFAGIYEVIDSEYFRIGVSTAVWTGQTRFIGSVDENTFSYNDYWGSFAWTGNQFNFDIDFETDPDGPTFPISVPDPVDGLFSGNIALDCSVNPELFQIYDCTGTNVLEPNEETGEHIIKLTYGYYTNGSGPREFQEVLKKVVN
jgi:hypothetical protein